MRKAPHKTPFRCPSCGFVQLEPPHLISTYCRACGDYYEVERTGARKREVNVSPAFTNQGIDLRKKVFCHHCGTTHKVSPHARSTICPGCNAAIELQDVSLFSPTSVPVDTRGKLFIGASGTLSNSWIICGSARIEGGITGTLHSEGEVCIATSQRCVCKIIAPLVFVEKHASAWIVQPIETDHLIVKGHLQGFINCRGTIHVLRGGRLNAEVRARGIVVDKGGSFVGNCQVDKQEPTGHAVLERIQHQKKVPKLFVIGTPCPSY